TGIVLGRVLLGDQQDLLVVLHDLFERLDALLAADEQRHDHAWEHDDVAQRQDGIDSSLGGGVHDASLTTLLELSRTAAKAPQRRPAAYSHAHSPKEIGPNGLPFKTVDRNARRSHRRACKC